MAPRRLDGALVAWPAGSCVGRKHQLDAKYAAPRLAGHAGRPAPLAAALPVKASLLIFE